MNYKNILDVIGKCDDIGQVKDIINSINQNQVYSKEWLVESCFKHIEAKSTGIIAGWYGFLGDMLTRSGMCDDITVYDMDPKCTEIGLQLYPHLKHTTQRMADINPNAHDQIICTSCEHISDEELNDFLNKRTRGQLVVLHSNDYYGIPGHINCKGSLDEFKMSLNLEVVEALELETHKYKRFMVIGY